MFPDENETITCDYCRKTVKATKDMKEWYCVSGVKGGEESNWAYFCSPECLKAWVIESSALFLERRKQQEEDMKWVKKEEKRRNEDDTNQPKGN